MLFLLTSLFSLSVVAQLTHWSTNSGVVLLSCATSDPMLMLSFSFWSFLSERHHFFLLYVKLGYLIFCDQCKCKHNKMSKNESLIFFSPVLTEKIEVMEEIFREVLEWSANLCRVERITNPLLGKMAQTRGFGSLFCILRLD